MVYLVVYLVVFMSQVKVTFFLPIRDNDGRDLSIEISEVEERCYEAFGAWTLIGYFKGTWRMATGERKLDTSVVYMVAINEKQIVDLETILKNFKKKTTQESVFLEIERNVEIRLV